MEEEQGGKEDGEGTPTEGPSHRTAGKQPRQATTAHDQVIEEGEEERNERTGQLPGTTSCSRC